VAEVRAKCLSCCRIHFALSLPFRLFGIRFMTFYTHGQCLAHYGNPVALDLIVSLSWSFVCIAGPVISTMKKMLGPWMLNYSSLNSARK